MSEPVIARRCPTCGVSIREAALFCPQCGNTLPRGAYGETQPLVNGEAEEMSPKSASNVSDATAEAEKKSRKDAPAGSVNESQKKTRHTPQEDEAVNSAPGREAGRASMGQAALGAVGAQIQRATTLARDVEGDVIYRARKVREISSVVLDEAGDDPSLRFVLVVAALFLLFLIIVVLNRFIT